MAMLTLKPGATTIHEIELSHESPNPRQSGESTSISDTSSERQSQSAPSQIPGPTPLPPIQTKKRGRKPLPRDEHGNIIRPAQFTNPVQQASEAAESAMPQRRKLPDDEAELDKVLRRYKILAKPAINGLSHTLEVFDMSALDGDEKEGGYHAVAAMLYEFGAEMDSRLLFGLYLLGIMTPRMAELAMKKREQAKLKQAGRKVIDPKSLPAPQTTPVTP